MIKKPTIVITSLGRTGTKFLAILFRDLLSDATSVHEPDVFNFFQYKGMKKRLQQTRKQIREIGFYNLFVRKMLGRGSIIKLSDSRVRGELNHDETVERLLDQRQRIVASREGKVYVEASAGYYGLLDVLPNTYRYHRAAYIVRDGRDWIRSWMRWSNGAGMYEKGPVKRLFAHTWPTAAEIEEDPFSAKWTSLSRFGKLCWAWASLNRYALNSVGDNPDARVFRFEEVFKAENRYRHLADLISFVTDIPGVEPIPPDALEGWLDRRIHKSLGEFPTWADWSIGHKQQFTEICGPLMRELGYELN
jgi:hypothetical protein